MNPSTKYPGNAKSLIPAGLSIFLILLLCPMPGHNQPTPPKKESSTGSPKETSQEQPTPKEQPQGKPAKTLSDPSKTQPSSPAKDYEKDTGNPPSEEDAEEPSGDPNDKDSEGKEPKIKKDASDSPYSESFYPQSFFMPVDEDEYDSIVTTYYRPPELPIDALRGHVDFRPTDPLGVKVTDAELLEYKKGYHASKMRYFTQWDFHQMTGAEEFEIQEADYFKQLAFEDNIHSLIYRVTYGQPDQVQKIEELVLGKPRHVMRYEHPVFLVLTGFESIDDQGEFQIYIKYYYNDYGSIIRKEKYELGTCTQVMLLTYQYNSSSGKDRLLKKEIYYQPSLPSWKKPIDQYLTMLGFSKTDLSHQYSVKIFSYDPFENPALIKHFIGAIFEYKNGMMEPKTKQKPVLLQVEKLSFSSLGKVLKKEIYFEDPSDNATIKPIKSWERQTAGNQETIVYFDIHKNPIDWDHFAWIEPFRFKTMMAAEKGEASPDHHPDSTDVEALKNMPSESKKGSAPTNSDKHPTPSVLPSEAFANLKKGK